MSFVRASLRARSTLGSVRRYASQTPPRSSNLPLLLLAGGVAGLAGYVYLEKDNIFAATPVKPRKVQEKSPFDPEAFVDFKLKKIEPYNHNTATYIFELPNDDASLLPVASCVVVKSAADSSSPLLDTKGKPIIRPYTPVSPSDQPGELAFLIKRYEEGKMSQHIHGLKPGESLAIKGPIMKIEYKANEFDEVGMIAGGSGITPMYQILTKALADPSNKTKFTLLFANVTPKDILLRSEFDDLQKKYPETFKVVYTVDKPEDGWKGPTGFIDRTLITQHLPASSLGSKIKILICGPPGQVASLAGKKDGYQQGALGGVLKELGYTEGQVFKF